MSTSGPGSARGHRRSHGRALKGMILAAGYGRRFRPLTLRRAKPSIPFLNRPLGHYSLELFKRLRVQDLVINLHHAPDSVISSVASYLSLGTSWNPRLEYSWEKEILGTAGGIGNAREALQGGDILVSNGKIFFEDGLKGALRQHREEDAWVTLVLVPHNGEEPYNPVIMDSEGGIVDFRLKSEMSDFAQCYIYTGVQFISDRVLPFIPRGYSDSVRDLYPELMKKGYPIRGYVSPEYWCECSWPRRFLENTLQVLGRAGRVNCVSGSADPQWVGVVAADDARVGPGCTLHNVILLDGVSVGPESSLTNAIICPGSDLPARTSLADVVVTAASEEVPQDMAGDVEAGPGGRCLSWRMRGQ